MKCRVCDESVPSDNNRDSSLFNDCCSECRDRLSKALKDSLFKTSEMTVRAYFNNFCIPDDKIDELFKEVPPLWFFRGEK